MATSPSSPARARGRPGAEFYPHDITKEEFERAAAASPKAGEALRSLYTLVRREAGGLRAVPYHEAFAGPSGRAAAKLREAAKLAEDPGLRKYLELRARALETDDYRPSDLAWMDMKHNLVDVVIGPIETYEDELFGYKAAHEALRAGEGQGVERRLARYATLLPELQRGLPVPAAYKREKPGTRFRPQRLRRPLLRRRRPTRAPRPSPSICRTTSRCSSRRARAGCSSRTPCARSSTRFSCRSPAS